MAAWSTDCLVGERDVTLEFSQGSTVVGRYPIPRKQAIAYAQSILSACGVANGATSASMTATGAGPTRNKAGMKRRAAAATGKK